MAKNKGFTLIELMVVVGIVGILVSIAYPSYVNYLYKSSRAEAMATLLDIANRQEQYYSDNHKYTPFLADLGVASSSDTGLFLVTLNATDSTFEIIASPLKHPATNDDQCLTFTLDELGQKSSTGSGGNSICWNK